MPTVTRTIHPLPFEHLDPRRFEDLIRQLAYDFRNWRALEAAGASGADGSFDVRGWEVVNEDAEDRDEEDREEEIVTHAEDRLWLIQCKREKAIGPARIEAYVDEIPKTEGETLHGVIVAAACNISKATRDRFRERCRAAGYAKCYVWSRSEIEDMLFQPKNDGLLFAYFGISLTIRRRASATRLRARLATKRKLLRALGNGEHLQKRVMFIDPDDIHYPYLPEVDTKREGIPWKIHTVYKNHPRGIIVLVRKFQAYLHDDRVQWDIADAAPTHEFLNQNPWVSQEELETEMKSRTDLRKLELEWPPHNRATVTLTYLISFEDIIDIDKDGDTYFDDPIIYVQMKKGDIPGTTARAKLVTNVTFSRDVNEIPGDGDGRGTKIIRDADVVYLTDKHANRIEVFPAKFRHTTEQ